MRKKQRTLGIAMVGHGFMGRAHSNAWRQVSHFFDLPAVIRMKTVCGTDRRRAAKAAKTLGWEHAETDWRAVMNDPEIDVVDICTPNDSHCTLAVAAARAGKAILCEKPLARNLREAEQMAAAAKKARVVNMVCHNYRFVPAVAQARRMIERGDIGKRIFHFRARYAQDWLVDPDVAALWRLRSEVAGSGALGDIFSHALDLARYLVGELTEVCAEMATFIKERPNEKTRSKRSRVDVDDAASMLGRFRGGGLATIEATRMAAGRKNSLTFEINGDRGSLVFDLENMNVLRFFSGDDATDARGFREIIVTEQSHPYAGRWWPPGHILGYEHTFVHAIAEFVRAVSARKKAEPDFSEGLKNQRVLDAIARSARTRRWIRVSG